MSGLLRLFFLLFFQLRLGVERRTNDDFFFVEVEWDAQKAREAYEEVVKEYEELIDFEVRFIMCNSLPHLHRPLNNVRHPSQILTPKRPPFLPPSYSQLPQIKKKPGNIQNRSTPLNPPLALRARKIGRTQTDACEDFGRDEREV